VWTESQGWDSALVRGTVGAFSPVVPGFREHEALVVPFPHRRSAQHGIHSEPPPVETSGHGVTHLVLQRNR